MNFNNFTIKAQEAVQKGQEIAQALQKADTISKEMKDEFVTIEHMILGLLTTKGQASRLFKDNGVTEKDLTTAIRQLRQGSAVTGQNAEETYQTYQEQPHPDWGTRGRQNRHCRRTCPPYH